MITIEQQPYGVSALGQKLIVVASSDNVSEDGFKYYVYVVNSIGDIIELYVTPNPANKLIFDAAPLIKQWVNVKPAVTDNGSPLFTAPLTDTPSNHAYPINEPFNANPLIRVNVAEAWMVDGVLTVNSGSVQQVEFRTFAATHQVSEGYKPNTNTVFGMNGTTSRALSDRLWNTYNFDLSQSWGIGAMDVNRTFIPVREQDYGVVGVWGNIFTGDILNTANKYRVRLIPDTGSPVDWTSPVLEEACINHVPAFPANLNASTVVGVPKPSAYPNWKAIVIQFLNASNAIVGMSYVLFNMERAGMCQHRFPNVRLAWLNTRGDWDFFNFRMKNEEEINVERKRVKRLVGNYSGDTFGFNPYDRGLEEQETIVQQFINITSEWLQEGEFTLLKSLIHSKSVYIVNENATITPVVVEQNSYTQKRTRENSVQYNLELKLRYSSDITTV